MEKNNNLIYRLFLVLIVITVACTSRKNTETYTITKPSNAIVVKVIDYRELDGCEFLLELPDGKKIQPVNMPEKFRIPNLKLWITYKVVKGMGICMAGEMAELTFIQETTNK